MAKTGKTGTPQKGSTSVSSDSSLKSSASPQKGSRSSPRKRHIANVSSPAKESLYSSSHVSDSQSDSEDNENVSNEVLSIAKKISKRFDGKRQKLEWSTVREDSDSVIEPSQWKPDTNTRSQAPKVSSDSDLFNSENESNNIVKDTGAKVTSAGQIAAHDVSSDSSDSDDERSRPPPTRNISRNISKEPKKQSSTPGSRDKNTKSVVAETSVSNAAQKPMKLRFQCPASYSVRPFSPAALSLEDVKDQDVDLWLIKAPKKADMKILDNQEALVNGSVVLKKESSKSGTTFLWDLNCQQDAETAADSVCVLLPSKNDSNLHFAGEVKGHIQLTKSIQTSPYVIPQVAPKSRHQLPAGLKLRHQPFGSDTPVVSSSDERHKRKSRSRDSIDGDSFGHTPKSKKKKKHRRETE